MPLPLAPARTMRRQRFVTVRGVAAALLGLTISGCGDPAPPAQIQGLLALSQSSGSLVQVDTLSGLCSECVNVEEVILLGDEEGPGIYQGAGNVVVDDQGRFWVTARTHLTVFDSSGAYVMTVGSEGQGPGEFSLISEAYLATNGAIHVYDNRNSRLTALDPDGTVLWTEALPPGVVRSVSPHPDSGTVVNVEHLEDPEPPAAAVHVVRGSTVARYTTRESGSLRDNFWRHVAVDGEGIVYAAKNWDYVIDVWNQPGEPLGRIERLGLWERSPAGTSRALVPGVAPSASISDVSVIDDRWLVVVSWAKTEDWEDWVEEQAMPDGRPSLGLVPGAGTDKLWDSYVEVIDLKSFELMSTTRLPWLVNGFANDSLIFGSRMEGQVPKLVLSRITIAGRDQTL